MVGSSAVRLPFYSDSLLTGWFGHYLSDSLQLSVWGGPLRLQAAAQHAESPKHVLRRIIHHPIKWVKDLEEWKHLSSLRMKRNRTGKDQSRREHVFNPDPLLFPATWLPLRWLQILALSKAFSTDPLNYRWCSLTDDKVVIPRLMKQYLVQLALGDEWRRVCLGEKRVGLGIAVVLSYFVGVFDELMILVLLLLLVPFLYMQMKLLLDFALKFTSTQLCYGWYSQPSLSMVEQRPCSYPRSLPP